MVTRFRLSSFGVLLLCPDGSRRLGVRGVGRTGPVCWVCIALSQAALLLSVASLLTSILRATKRSHLSGELLLAAMASGLRDELCGVWQG